MLAGTGFLNAYAGTLYLIEALRHEGARVDVVVHDMPTAAAHYAELTPGCRLLYPEGRDTVGMMRRVIRRTLICLKATTYDALVVSEYFFIPEAILARRLRPRLFIAHYCQELVTPIEYPNHPGVRQYQRFACIPNVVIDVEPHRAQCRREVFGLPDVPWVLPNTIPTSRLPLRTDAGSLARLAAMQFPPDRRILVHAGGVGMEKPLERVIDAVAAAKHPVFFLAFCYGAETRIEQVRRYAVMRLAPGSFAVLGPRRREDLLACLHEADIGVIDYAPSVQPTRNQLFCAPTKLYEFMACGLALLTSRNPSMAKLVHAEAIGASARTDSPADFAVALDSLLEDVSRLESMKRAARKAFCEKYSYEQLCVPVVRQLVESIQSANSLRPGNGLRSPLHTFLNKATTKYSKTYSVRHHSITHKRTIHFSHKAKATRFVTHRYFGVKYC
jgi:glycosyltransferase involved in cell wall biosynthesis